MFLGALIDAGVDPDLMRRTAAALKLAAELQISTVDRSGISCTKVDVLTQESITHAHQHQHNHNHSHGHHHLHEHSHEEDFVLKILGKLVALLSRNHVHHQEHRSLSEIKQLIHHLEISENARQIALRAFQLLGEAEAAIHNVPIERIHFHEVGAVDSIVDIVCGAVGADALSVERWICSPVNVGGGTVKCAHGTFPVPAPATMRLLQGAPVYSGEVQKELVTPTGAALIRALGCEFGQLPPLLIERSGYGAGSRNTPSHPNALRIFLGESVQPETLGVPSSTAHGPRAGELDSSRPRSSVTSANYRRITVIESAIDDANPQLLGYLSERSLALGALDFYTTPIQMKKGRPATLVTLLCRNEDTQRMSELLFRETTTIGLRYREEDGAFLDREIVEAATPWGTVHVKLAKLNGEIVNAAPEYDDCRKLALENNIPLKAVQQEALRAVQQNKQLAISSSN
jgi:uncharacterized protein (TIGR00299 family) protein